MQRLYNTRTKFTGKMLGILTAIFIFMFILMNVLAAQITANTGNQILDFVNGYSPEQSVEILSSLGDNGRTAYFNLIVPWDFIFPIIYTLFLVALNSFALNKAFSKPTRLDIFVALPLLAMIFDWLENAAILQMLAIFPNKSAWLALLGSTATIFKSSFTWLTLLFPLGLLLFHKFFRRK